MNEAREQIGINAAKSRTCTVLHLPVSVLLIYNEKAIHSQLHAYLMVTLNHGVKMLARGRKRGKTCFFPLSTFSAIAHSRWEQKWQEGIWGFLSPKSKVSLPATAAVGVAGYTFCSNPIKDLSHNLSHKLCLCSMIVPKISTCETEMTEHNRHHNSHRIFTCELFMQIVIYLLQIGKSWARSRFCALDVDVFEDLTLIRLRSGDSAEEARGWGMSEVNVHGVSQSLLGLTHRLAEIRQNSKLQV